MRKFIDILLVIFIIVLAIVISVTLASGFLESLIVPDDYLFYEHNPFCSNLLVVFLIVPVFYFALILIKKIGLKYNSELPGLYDMLRRYLPILPKKHFEKGNFLVVIVWLMVIYFCLTSLTYVTEDKIVIMSPFNPSGQEYSYSDVEEIETGFGNKTFSFFEYKQKGSFYYKITVDGKEIVFHLPSVNPNVDRYSDTYLELEEFDQALVELKIPKVASSKGYENCSFDQEYVDRFLRIIELK